MVGFLVHSWHLLSVPSQGGRGKGALWTGAHGKALIPFVGHHLHGLNSTQRLRLQQHHLWGLGFQYEFWRRTDIQTITTPAPGRASSPGAPIRVSATQGSFLCREHPGGWRSLWVVLPAVGVVSTVTAAGPAGMLGAPGDVKWCVHGGHLCLVSECPQKRWQPYLSPLAPGTWRRLPWSPWRSEVFTIPSYAQGRWSLEVQEPGQSGPVPFTLCGARGVCCQLFIEHLFHVGAPFPRSWDIPRRKIVRGLTGETN